MKPTIESLQNPKIKAAIRLRESRQRRKAGLILVDGQREINVACGAGVQFESIYCTVELAMEMTATAQQPWSIDAIQPVSETVLAKLSYGERMSRAVGVATAPESSIERLAQLLETEPEPLLLVLDRVEKPGNIGAVVRTVASSGAHGLILVDPQCDVFNPNAIRASLGTIFTLPIAVASFSQLAAWLELHKIRLVRACVDGNQSMWSVNLTGPLAIALGSEAWGLGGQWRRDEWAALKIPMKSGADSLNLSVSAALLCYESLRQRSKTHPTGL